VRGPSGPQQRGGGPRDQLDEFRRREDPSGSEEGQVRQNGQAGSHAIIGLPVKNSGRRNLGKIDGFVLDMESGRIAY
jgi:hypothetical protein